ncbi:MAG: rod shape-determining protein RodA [Planctomycetes bacterium]|nr:rod shape-determining protein RodA [Planctomycetota bacterium]
MSARLELLQRIDWWVVLLAATLGAIGVLMVGSATHGLQFEGLAQKQMLYLCAGVGLGIAIVLVPFSRVRRLAWPIYFAVVAALALLPVFGAVLNGARRWYVIFGFGLQPSEFAKCAVVLAVAAWLRFRDASRLADGIVLPLAITTLPVLLVFLQPDLGSSLVFWPTTLGMCYAAGARVRHIAVVVALGLALLVLGWFTVLHDYQKTRVLVWLQHFGWDRAAVDTDPGVREVLLGDGFQPWQSLIAIGSGGWTGFGYMQGPQNRFEFLPYRSGDYVFAVVCEETGLLGALGVIGLELALVTALLGIAIRTRERFGRLCAVGIATWIGTQALIHVAVCSWLLPSTGLPMPFISHGGSATLAVWTGIALVVSVGARNEPVLARE